MAGNTGLEPILPQSKCGVLPLHKFPVCCLSFQAAIPYWSPSYSPTWGSPRYPCGFRGVTLSSGAFLCGARCLLHIRKLETHAGTDIRESNPTHRVLETPSPPWNICPHICPADIPAGAEKRRENSEPLLTGGGLYNTTKEVFHVRWCASPTFLLTQRVRSSTFSTSKPFIRGVSH